VLILPPGGFGLKARPGLMDPVEEAARAAGFEPRVIQYPIFDLPGALEFTVQAAREAEAAYAYGESAGGLVAARITQLGAVERAAVNAPISNLFTWPLPAFAPKGFADGWNHPPEELAHLSPAFHRTENPIDILHSTGDDIVPFIDSLLWSRRDPEGVRLHVVEDPHIGGPTYAAKLKLAFDLLRGRSDLRRRLEGRIPARVRGRLSRSGGH
jgi:hypothetical protein